MEGGAFFRVNCSGPRNEDHSKVESVLLTLFGAVLSVFQHLKRKKSHHTEDSTVSAPKRDHPRTLKVPIWYRLRQSPL
jgi:hypothetical protein